MCNTSSRQETEALSLVLVEIAEGRILLPEARRKIDTYVLRQE
jgi:hypothetical protein